MAHFLRFSPELHVARKVIAPLVSMAELFNIVSNYIKGRALRQDVVLLSLCVSLAGNHMALVIVLLHN